MTLNKNVRDNTSKVLDCYAYVQSKSGEKMLTDKLRKIAEVNQLIKGIEKNKRKVFVIITARPSHSDSYYEIQTGYEDASGFDDTKYIFRIKKEYISQINIEPYLEIIDLSRGAYIPLISYRKNNHR
jgi:hypothetical protein